MGKDQGNNILLEQHKRKMDIIEEEIEDQTKRLERISRERELEEERLDLLKKRKLVYEVFGLKTN